MDALAWVVVGTDDLNRSLDFWHGRFGIPIVAESNGADPGLSGLLDLDESAVADAALVGSAPTGRLLFVEFREPGVPVRAGAGWTDSVPKNINVMCRDLPGVYEGLLADGYRFRSEWVEYPESESGVVREVQLILDDHSSVSLVEIVGDDQPAGGHWPQGVTFSDEGFVATTSQVTVIDDPDAEMAFYTDGLGWPTVMNHVLTGAHIEKMVGLPPGNGLDMRLFGPEGYPFGRVELVHYQGLETSNHYSKAVAPNLGVWGGAVEVDDSDPIISASGGCARARGTVDTFAGSFDVTSIRTPGGWRLDLLES